MKGKGLFPRTIPLLNIRLPTVGRRSPGALPSTVFEIAHFKQK
jgi:hypothetical protein